MRHQRQLVLLSLASFAALVVAACGTAPSEKSATEGQDLTIPKCPAGEEPSCSGDGPQGQTICTCVAMPPVCNWIVPAGAPADDYVASWSVLSTNGTCPPIPGAGGTWENLQPTPAGDAFDGVPCEVKETSLPATTCSAFFPGEVNGQGCCTYVWWPADFSPPSTGCNVNQDPQVLCQHTGTTYNATLGGLCGDAPDGGDEDGGHTICNGGSSCGTCLPLTKQP
jgi:hypothetical protein